MVPDPKFNNSFVVFGGTVIKCNGLSKPLSVFLGPLGVDYHAVITLNFKTVLMKHPVVVFCTLDTKLQQEHVDKMKGVMIAFTGWSLMTVNYNICMGNT